LPEKLEAIDAKLDGNVDKQPDKQMYHNVQLPRLYPSSQFLRGFSPTTRAPGAPRHSSPYPLVKILDPLPCNTTVYYFYGLIVQC